MDNVIDNLQIEIESSSTSASDKIKKLISSLRKLDKLGQSNGISNLNKDLKKFSNLEFSKVSRQLSKIANSLKTINQNRNAIGNIRTEPSRNTRNTNARSNGTPQAESLLGEEDFGIDVPPSNTASRLQEITSAATQTGEAIGDIASSSSEATSAVGSLKEKMSNTFAGFMTSLKRIALYRIIRTIVSAIGNAFKEGIGNLVQYSSEANETISKLKSSTQQLKNSFATALMPVIQAFTPLLVSLTDALSGVLNQFSAFFAMISFKGSYTKAIKNNQDYAASLKKVQNAQLGIDELNVISDNTENSPSDMFETVDLSFGEVVKNLVGVATTITTIILLLKAFKGEQIASIFTKLAGGAKNLMSNLKNMSTLKKSATSLALLAAEAVVCYDAFYGLFTGTKNIGEVLLALIPICALVGVAMYAMWGPVGLIIMAVVAALSALVAGFKAVTKAAYDKAMQKYWKVTGKSIEDATKSVKTYMKALGIDKQNEWNETLAEANDALVDAIYNYDSMYHIISNHETIDAEDIRELSEAFNELADAANAVNEASINSLMASIKTGIELNITPELTNKLTGLISSLETAQDLLNVKISGIKGEYQKELDKIASQGGQITPEQKAMLDQLRAEISKFSLSDNTASEHWAETLRETGNITAGSSRDEVEDKVKKLNEERGTYLETLKTNYSSSVGTLRQLIELDRTEFGGSLGLYEEGKTFEENSNYKALLKSYQAQVNEVNNQFNSILDALAKTFKDAMGEDPRAWYKYAFSWIPGLWHNYGEMSAYSDQEDLVNWILGQKGYATGGFPEDDSLIWVNPYEVVGKMSNGKNVVANNQQIIEGIKEGVYEATLAANQQNGGNGDNEFEVRVFLDGRQITSTVEKYQKKKGVGGTIYKGGILNGI